MINRDFYLVNTNNRSFDIRLIIISKEECEDIDARISNLRNQSDVNRFIDSYNISPIDIVLYGDSDLSILDLETRTFILEEFKKILDKPKTVKNAITNKIEHSYKCFCCDDRNVSDLIEHRTVYSSFCCLMTKLKKPKYILIYKMKV